MSTSVERFDRGGPIGWTARHPVLPNLLMLLLMIGGIVGGLSLPRSQYPDFQLPYAELVIELPGATADQVNDAVVQRVESALEGIDTLQRIYSRAEPGRATFAGFASSGPPPPTVVTEIQQAVASVSDMPADARVDKIAITRQPYIVTAIAIYGEVAPQALLAAADTLRARLLAEPAIDRVELQDGGRGDLAIEVPRHRLVAHGLTLEAVAEAVREAVRPRAGGALSAREGMLALDIASHGAGLDALAEIRVPAGPGPGGFHGAPPDAGALPDAGATVEGGEAAGPTVRLGDIATMRRDWQVGDGRVLFDGQPAVKLAVYRVGDRAPDAIAEASRAHVAAMADELPEAMSITVAWDGSVPLVDRLELLAINGAVGLGLVLLLLSLFLDLRLAFWVAVGIPTAFMGALALLALTDLTLNPMTLFAFILALGLLVDDAIVAGENIYEYRDRGFAPADAAVMGARDIAVPLSFSVITNILAFIPIMMIPGWYGMLYGAIPVVVTLAFLVSWGEALLVLPGHLAGVRARERRQGPLARLQRATAAGIAWVVRRLYGPCLRVAVAWRYATVALLAGLLALSVAWTESGRMGFTLMPSLPKDYAVLSVTLPSAAPPDEAEAVRRQLTLAAERVVAENGGRLLADSIESQVEDNKVTVIVHFTPSDVRPIEAAAFVARARALVGPVPAAERTSFAGGGQGPGSGPRLAVMLRHADEAALRDAAASLAGALAGLEAAEDVDDGYGGGTRVLRFRLTEAGRQLGFTEASVAAQVRDAFHGRVALRVPDGDGEIALRVSLPAAERDARHDVESLLIGGPDGLRAPLFAVAEAVETRATPRIDRERGRRSVEVAANLGTPEALARATAWLKERVLPALEAQYPGLDVAFRGDEEAKQQTLDSLTVTISLTVALMYGVLAIPFRSWIQPTIVLATIPFGFAGAVLGHLLMGMSLTMVSVLGMVALGGVVVNAALVMIDYANKARAAGHGPATAMQLAGERRFRPILLTTLTTFGGLAPMIFEASPEAKLLQPIAVSLGFGILFATVAVLFLVPALYLIVEDLRWLANPKPRPLPSAGIDPASGPNPAPAPQPRPT
ncbi:MAG: efflux RND transporter permease subunit [Pseudomonadota bacterium]